ncbi:MAG: zinc ribbon domain-containing protein [Thermoplasmata archaeon]|nr:MAG: zinc ribbon domain-containing protein [Thermoplasmata archaeon]
MPVGIFPGSVNVTSGSCPRCRSPLEGDANFCHSCGLDLYTAAGSAPQATAPPVPYQPGFAALPMIPAPGTEAPANPMGHGRALASMASIVIFFTASLIFLFGMIYLSDRAFGWEDTWDGDSWRSDTVIFWEWMMVGVLFIASFGAGIAGGIAAARATRFPLAFVSAMMLLACAIILQWDYRNWMGDPWGEIAYILIMALLALALLMLSKDAFTSPRPVRGEGPPSYATDAYGWAAAQGENGDPRKGDNGGVGR